MICLGRIVASLFEKSVKFSPRQDRPAAPPSALSSSVPAPSTSDSCVPKHRLLHVLILKTLWVGPSELKSGAGPEHQHFNRLPGLLRSAVRDSVLPSLWEQNTWGDLAQGSLGSHRRCAASVAQVPVVSLALPASSASAAQNPHPSQAQVLRSSVLSFKGPVRFFSPCASSLSARLWLGQTLQPWSLAFLPPSLQAPGLPLLSCLAQTCSKMLTPASSGRTSLLAKHTPWCLCSGWPACLLSPNAPRPTSC